MDACPNPLAVHAVCSLRSFFLNQKETLLRAQSETILAKLSPAFQAQVISMIHGKWLKKLSFLRPFKRRIVATGRELHFEPEDGCLVQLVMRMEPRIFAPSEVASERGLYVVKRGIVLFESIVLSSGRVWGDDIILSDTLYTKRALGRAMTFVDASMLSRETLVDIMSSFPVAAKIVRRSALLLALRRAIIHLARDWRMLTKYGRGGGAFSVGMAGGTRKPAFKSLNTDFINYSFGELRRMKSSPDFIRELSAGNAVQGGPHPNHALMISTDQQDSAAVEPLRLPGQLHGLDGNAEAEEGAEAGTQQAGGRRAVTMKEVSEKILEMRVHTDERFDALALKVDMLTEALLAGGLHLVTSTPPSPAAHPQPSPDNVEVEMPDSGKTDSQPNEKTDTLTA